MPVPPVLQGKNRDLPRVCGREFLNSCFSLGPQGSQALVPNRPRRNTHQTFQKGHPTWGVLMSSFLNSSSASTMCYPSQVLLEDACQQLCGGSTGGENLKLGSQHGLSSLVPHKMGLHRISLGGDEKIISCIAQY